jgi:hypothetical protein
MNRSIQHLLRTSSVAFVCLFSVGTTVAQERAQVPASQSSEARKPVPTRKLELAVPAKPLEKVQLYCCTPQQCIEITQFQGCLPQWLKMVCDDDGICFPINAVVMGGKLISR